MYDDDEFFNIETRMHVHMVHDELFNIDTRMHVHMMHVLKSLQDMLIKQSHYFVYKTCYWHGM